MAAFFVDDYLHIEFVRITLSQVLLTPDFLIRHKLKIFHTTVKSWVPVVAATAQNYYYD